MSQLRVRDLMTKEVVSVHPDDGADRIYDVLTERGIRHVAVIDDEGELVGVVCQGDLLRHPLFSRPDLPPFLRKMLLRQIRVEEIMTSEVETAKPDQPIEEAVRVMSERRIGCLPVVEDWRVVGILTDAEIARRLGPSLP